jgi:hypothetical protein
VVEAWPASWRKDPPRPLPVTEASPGAFTLGRLLRAWRIDPRVASALALAIAAAIGAFAAASRSRPAVLGILLLCPAVVGSVLFGGGESVRLGLLTAGLVLAIPFFLGAASAGSMLAAVVAPIGLRTARAWAAVAVGFVAASAALLFGFPDAFLRVLSSTGPLRPGVDLSNLFYYRPDLPASALPFLHGSAAIALALLGGLLARDVRRGASALAAAAVATTTAAFLWPGTEGAAVAIPIALFALEAARTVDRPAPAP